MKQTCLNELPPTDDCRTIFGSFPTGVTVVTAPGASGDPVGMAINSFTSLSLDPLLVLICVGKNSSTWPAIEESGQFCVNVLAEDQAELALRFAAKDNSRFEGVNLRSSVIGSPILTESLAFIDCKILRIDPGGDHWIVVGTVVEMASLREASPLIFSFGVCQPPQSLASSRTFMEGGSYGSNVLATNRASAGWQSVDE